MGCQPTLRDLPLGWLAWPWALASLLGWAAGHLPLLWAASALESSLSLPHPVALMLFAAGGALLGGALAHAAGRWILGVRLRVTPAALAVLLAGAAIAGGVELALADWAIRRYGYLEPDFIGPTTVLFGIISGQAVAAFGGLLAPAEARTPARLAAICGAVMALLVIGSNARGLEGGLPPDSLALATALVIAGGYSLLVGAAALLTGRRGG